MFNLARIDILTFRLMLREGWAVCAGGSDGATGCTPQPADPLNYNPPYTSGPLGSGPAQIASDPAPPIRALVGRLSYPRCALDSHPPLLSSPLLPSSPPHRAELDAHRHNRWYSTTGCRSARIWCRRRRRRRRKRRRRKRRRKRRRRRRRSTFIYPNFTGTFSVAGARGGSPRTDSTLAVTGSYV